MQENHAKQQPISSERESTRLRSASPIQDGVLDTELAATDYYSSSFPSLLTQLGTDRDKKVKTKQKRKEVHRTSADHHRHRDEETLSYAEEMRRKNEVQWMRIQAVAKEKLDRYDKYAKDMLVKVRKQREQINRRSQELLESLARQEEKKKEDRFNDSAYGRIWRHHRTMQRRAFSLEPMSRRDKNTFQVTSLT